MIKKSILFIILVSAICMSGLTLAKSGRPVSVKIKLPFRVVDDAGKPVYQASVDGYFWSPYTSNAAGDAFNENTDTNGYCIIKGRGYSYIEGEVTKPGYYKTHYKISLGNVNQARKTKKWSLEKVKVILREKKNPIPMYAKNVRANVPGTNEWYGYDFMLGDWVKPYGKGKVSDMQVKIYDMLDGVLGNWKLWYKKLIISFNANHFDGVELFNRKNWSQYSSPYNAPESGYIKTIESEFKRTPDKILLDAMIKEKNVWYFAVVQ